MNDCIWHREDNEDDFNELWLSGCGQDFMINDNSTPAECHMKFCMFCGKPLEQESK